MPPGPFQHDSGPATNVKRASPASELHLPFRDRTQAGRALAEALSRYRDRADMVVLALPRGGVPVAAQVAAALRLPLDVMIVRKLGVPWQEELAMGAVASGGARVLNADVVASAGIPGEEIERSAQIQLKEIERRERAYRGGRPWPEVRGRHVILVDDGIATGATMRVAVKALRQLGVAGIVVAVPVAPGETVSILQGEADEVVCLAVPEPFYAVGSWYVDFRQVSDEEVREQLEARWRSAAAPAARHE